MASDKLKRGDAVAPDAALAAIYGKRGVIAGPFRWAKLDRLGAMYGVRFPGMPLPIALPASRLRLIASERKSQCSNRKRSTTSPAKKTAKR